MKLPDLNVWLAALWDGHAAHPAAAGWFEEQEGPIALCRVTQMGILRLLTNPSIMREDALDRKAAWEAMEVVRQDPRVCFLGEPDGLEKLWIQFSKRPDQAHKLWTDDYLCAFAFAGEIKLVTFDKSLATRHPAVAAECLTC